MRNVVFLPNYVPRRYFLYSWVDYLAHGAIRVTERDGPNLLAVLEEESHLVIFISGPVGEQIDRLNILHRQRWQFEVARFDYFYLYEGVRFRGAPRIHRQHHKQNLLTVLLPGQKENLTRQRFNDTFKSENFGQVDGGYEAD